MAQWELNDGVGQVGPLDEDHVIRMLQQGVPPQTVVRAVGEAEWRSPRSHAPFAVALEARAAEAAMVVAAPPGGYPPPVGYPPAQAYGAPYGYAPPSAPMMHAQPAPLVWTCPYCRFQGEPRTILKTSTAGWIVFVVMILFCITLPFCWIGLLIRDRHVLCPSCSSPVGGAH